MEPLAATPKVDPLAFLLSIGGGKPPASPPPSPLHGRTWPPPRRGTSARPEATPPPSRTAAPETSLPRPGPPPKTAPEPLPRSCISDAIKEAPQTAPPPPPKLIEYVSPLVNASRLAYMAAPPDVRAALDALIEAQDFWKIERNAWSGDVGVWTRTGNRSAQGEAVLKRFPFLRQWVLGLRAKCWQPWEIGRQYFTPEDVAILGLSIPDEVEGLPEELRRRPRR